MITLDKNETMAVGVNECCSSLEDFRNWWKQFFGSVFGIHGNRHNQFFWFHHRCVWQPFFILWSTFSTWAHSSVYFLL